MLPYFYHKELTTNNTAFNLTEETSKHCVQVLRMQDGAQLHLTNGKGLKALVRIVTAHKKNTLVKLISSTQSEQPLQQNTIAISLVKNNARLEWFAEKVTELGIYEIVPLLCKRTERQVFKYERIEGIMISAMLQSQQVWLPILQQPLQLSTYVSIASQKNKCIAHCVDGDKNKLQNVLQKNTGQVILIGPEGDFTPEEIALALQQQFTPVTLGNTRLRTETAGVVAATVMQLL
jgi:16S rRNA (uracil1498-N3)-methyltransferase